MDCSPPALIRSPTHSPRHSNSPGLDIYYPSPGQYVEPLCKIDPAAAVHGPLVVCATAPAVMDDHHPLPYHLDGTTSAEWTEATLIHSGPSAGGLGILSSEYVSYGGGYDSTIPPTYSHDMYSAHLATTSHVLPSHAPHHMPCRSPDPASSSSRHHSYSYASASPQPRIKVEGGGHDYASGAEHSQYSSPRSVQASVMEPSSYGSHMGGAGSDYLSDAPSGSWAKPDYLAAESDPYYSGPVASSSSSGSRRRQQQHQHQHQQHQQQQQQESRRPKRQPRKLTSKEEANFQCEFEGCGKLFSRSYNYKAHMETHDKKREYPFVCTVDDCDKKFVRKTDLQRHHQSVHMKEKNHRCDYCGRLFARKDTLRRHMEDGCSKRFDIGTMDVRGGQEGYDAYDVPPRPMPSSSSSSHLMAPTSQLPPMTLTRAGSRGDHRDRHHFHTRR